MKNAQKTMEPRRENSADCPPKVASITRLAYTLLRLWCLKRNFSLFIPNIPRFGKMSFQVCTWTRGRKVLPGWFARWWKLLLFAQKFKWFFIGFHHETCASFDLQFSADDGWAGASNPEAHPNPTPSHVLWMDKASYTVHMSATKN